MDEQRQPDTDPAGKRGTRRSDDAEAKGGRGPGTTAATGTDAEPDVEGHLLAAPEGYRGSRATRAGRKAY